MKFIHGESGMRLLGVTCGLLLFALAECGRANPTAPSVVQGTVVFSGTIPGGSGGANTAINWGAFSISVGELTRFVQSSGASAVLNRVAGPQGQTILGVLQSGGQVRLINRNGVVLSPSGQIDLQARVVNSLALSGKGFVSSAQLFRPDQMTIGPSGFTTAAAAADSRIYMAGDLRHVTSSVDGVVTLAAGHSIELVDPVTPGLRVQISAPADAPRDLGRIVSEVGSAGIYAGLTREGAKFDASHVALGTDGSLRLQAGQPAMLQSQPQMLVATQ